MFHFLSFFRRVNGRRNAFIPSTFTPIIRRAFLGPAFLVGILMLFFTSKALSQDTWYSYNSGDWNDPTVWTLDGSLAPVYDNPLSEIPGSSDIVYITSGKTVTVNINSISIDEMNVIGVLDIANTNSHNFNTIRGSGKIRIAGSGGAGNFPAGTSTDFADTSTGGTIEVYGGADFSLDITDPINDLLVNMTAGFTVFIDDDLDVDGDILITQGIFSINDDVLTTNLNLNVDGNITVESAGSILTGDGNNSGTRHELNLQGDLTNNGGTIEFTNRVAADYANEAIDGIVDLNLINTVTDQNLLCNGSTTFYRIEINKGLVSKVVYLSANNASFFNLYGYSDEDHDTSTPQLISNDNAVGLLNGTLDLGNNIDIDQLSDVNGVDYVISENASIVVSSGSLTKSLGTTLTVFGSLVNSGGTINVPISDGVVLKDAGQFNSSGGTTDLNQLYTLSDGATQGQVFDISGGTVMINGSSPNSSYKVFDLQYSTNVFNTSGGTLIVNGGDVVASMGVRIASNPDFNSATGGTFIAELSQSGNFKININANLWNFTMRGVSPAFVVSFDLEDEIVALGDLTILANPVFVALNPLGFDISVGRKFTIESGAGFLPSSNTISMIGGSNGEIDFDTPASPQQVFNFTIAKDDPNATVTMVNGNATAALIVVGELRVESGNLDYDSYNVEAERDVYVADSIGADGATGRLHLDGSTTQNITSVNGTMFNVELNNSNGFSMTGDMKIAGTLTMTNGIFDINRSKLTIDGANGAIVDNGGGFDNTFMIQTDGFASDGGLEFFVNSADDNTNILYPFGTDYDNPNDSYAKTTRYTPATINLSSIPASGGYVRISLADGAVPFLKPAQSDEATSFYWRVKYSGFTSLPDVEQYDFLSNAEDCQANGGDLKNWNPLKVIGGTRDSEDPQYGNGDLLITFEGDGTPFTLEDGSYFGGKRSGFNGSLATYYTYRNNDNNIFTWDDGGGWSTDPVSYINPGGNKYPEPGDIAVIQSDGTNWHRVATIDGLDVVEIRFDNSNPLANGDLPQLDIISDHTVEINEVSGEGHIRIRVNPGGAMVLPSISGDLESILTEPNSIFEYNATEEAVYENGTAGVSGTTITVPTILSSGSATDLIAAFGPENVNYNNLLIRASVDDPFAETYPLTFSMDINVGKLKIDDGGYYRTYDGADGNVDVTDSLIIGDGTREGLLEFHSGTDLRTVTVHGNLELKANSDIDVEDISNSVEHKLIAYQNIKKSSSSIFSTQNSAQDVFVELELTGTGTHTFENDGTDALDIYRIIMDKGSDTTSTFTINSDLTLSADKTGTTETKPIVLENGLLTLNDAGINETVVSAGGEFRVPSSTGLDLMAGELNIHGTNTGIRLDGLLRVSGGTLDMDNGSGDAYIRFSNTGSAKLELTAGNLNIASSLRRDLASSSGVLTYKQTDGNLKIGVRDAGSSTRGTFEVVGTGGDFTYTGGTITVIRGNTSTLNPSIRIDTDSYNVTQTIQIADGTTPSDGSEKNIGIYSTVPLSGINISNTNAPQVLIYNGNLQLTGTLTVDGTSPLAEFDTNGWDLTIGGDLTDNGTFTNTSGTVLFNSTSAQAINGSSATSFYNLSKSGAGGTLSLGKDISVNNNLTISSGTLDDNNTTLIVLGNVSIQGTHASTGFDGTKDGLKFMGSSEQLLEGLTSSTVSMGAITIQNANGVTVPANGYNFRIVEDLDLNVGIFDIGGALLTLGTSADVSGSFSTSTFISTNSSFTDNGVKKEFVDNVTTDFVFPVGELYYTPVTFEFSGGTSGTSTDGINPTSILVRPAREPHPSVSGEDCITGSPPSTNCPTDIANVLQYYWVVDGDNITGINSDLVLEYDQASVETQDPGFDETDYVGARYRFDSNPTNAIDILSSAVDDSNNTITISLSGSDASFSGDYTAGIETSFPANISSYETNGTGGGNVGTPATYAAPQPAGIPVGSIITVKTGDNLVLDVSDVSLYSIELESGSTLTVNDGTERHRLGVVTGTGTMKLIGNGSSVVLPAGLYIDFFNCTGGTLEYAGTGSYNIMGGISLVRNLKISDTGTKTFPSNDITICEDLDLSGSTLGFSSAITLSIGDDFLVQGGTYNHSGTLNITDELNISSGSFNGGASGDKNVTGNLVVSGGIFDAGTGGTVSVGSDISFSGGDFNSGSNTASIVLNGTTLQTLTGAFTSAPSGHNFFRLEIDNSSGASLAGNVDISDRLTLTNGLITPGGNTFRLLADAVIAIGGDGRKRGNSGSYINGTMYKTFSAAEQTASSSTPFIFPVGASGRWKYASLGSVSGDTEWRVEFISGDVTQEAIVDDLSIDPGSTVVTIQDGEYWKIADINGGGSAEVGLSWDATSNVSAVTEERERLVAMWWDNSANKFWASKGGENFSASHSQSQGDFISIDATTFSENFFTLGSEDASNPLPITLVEFDGVEVTKGIQLSWSTASELNNEFFEVEYSTDGENWKYLAKIDGAGTSKELNDYGYLHRSPQNGNNYYRLKQVDFNGEYTFSDIINVNIKKADIPSLEMEVYPNPVSSSEFTLSIQLIDPGQPFELHFLDDKGSRVFSKKYISTESVFDLRINTPTRSGMYFIHVAQGDFIKTTKLVVLEQ